MPLFVEEVTRLLLERGGEGVAQAIPPTLSSRSRRGSTGSAKGARSRIGAVLGRDFSRALRAVAGAAVAAIDYRAVAWVADRGPAGLERSAREGSPSGRDG